MIQTLKRLGLMLILAASVFIFIEQSAYAAGNFDLPNPSMSVHGNRLTITFPDKDIYYVFREHHSYTTAMDIESYGLIIKAQAFVPGLPVFELKGANNPDIVGNDSKDKWNSEVLNGTVELPFPGTRYAIWVEAFYDNLKGFGTSTGTGASGAAAMRLQARSYDTWYVTTEGESPNWFASAGSSTDISGIETILTNINNNFAAMLNILSSTNSYLSWLESDMQKPTLSLMWENGATITTKSSHKLFITASDNRTANGSLQLRINGGEWQAYKDVVLIPLTEGINEVTVEVKDQAGNTIVEKSPPLWKN